MHRNTAENDVACLQVLGNAEESRAFGYSFRAAGLEIHPWGKNSSHTVSLIQKEPSPLIQSAR